LLRSSSVVQKVSYGDGLITYRTFDKAATEVLRLTFKPRALSAGKVNLPWRQSLDAEGFTIRALPGGDYEVRVRHLNSNEIHIRRE
jgi:hypothetical protein